MIRVCAAVLAISLGACASAPDSGEETDVRGRYGAEAGELTVGIIADASLRDEVRKKDVPLAIDYPTRTDGPVPVIAFSHALGASQLDYAAYASHWASNGYVVIRVGHADAVRGFDRDEQSVVPGSAAEWVSRAHDRAADLKLVIESLPKLEQRYPELAGKLDVNRRGVAGHAFGALAAMITGGVRTFPGGTGTAAAGLKAVLAFSPPGPGERRGLTTESFRTLDVPTLFLTGTRDSGGDETETPQWREQGFVAAAPGDKWFVSISGAGRNTFSGIFQEVILADPGDGRVPYPSTPRDPVVSQLPPIARGTQSDIHGASRASIRRARATSLAFWDAYLRGDVAGREFLDDLATTGWAEVRRR